MSLNLDDKKTVVAQVSAEVANAQSIIVAEYRGLGVVDLTALRANARKSGVYLRVVKNTLVRRAIAGTPFEGLSGKLAGPLIYGISKDPVAAAKLNDKQLADRREQLSRRTELAGGNLASMGLQTARLDTHDIVVAGERMVDLPTMLYKMRTNLGVEHLLERRVRDRAVLLQGLGDDAGNVRELHLALEVGVDGGVPDPYQLLDEYVNNTTVKVVVQNVNIIKRHTNSRSDSNFKRKCFSASCILISKRIFIDSRKY